MNMGKNKTSEKQLEINRRYYHRNKDKMHMRNKKYYDDNRKQILGQKQDYYKKIKKDVKRYKELLKAHKITRLEYENRTAFKNERRNYRDLIKFKVLSHYSPGGVAHCSWPGCIICDIDCLTLDHINNNGAQHRKESRSNSGQCLYLRLRRQGFPEGYQTLCGGHQFKKEILRKRSQYSGVA